MQSNVAGNTDDEKGVLEKGGELIKRTQGLYGRLRVPVGDKEGGERFSAVVRDG